MKHLQNLYYILLGQMPSGGNSLHGLRPDELKMACGAHLYNASFLGGGELLGQFWSNFNIKLE